MIAIWFDNWSLLQTYSSEIFTKENFIEKALFNKSATHSESKLKKIYNNNVMRRTVKQNKFEEIKSIFIKLDFTNERNGKSHRISNNF